MSLPFDRGVVYYDQTRSEHLFLSLFNLAAM